MSIFTFIFPFNNSFSHITQLDDYSTPPLYSRERNSRGRGEEASERSRSVVASMASKLLLITVFILDLIAFGLAVAAEQRRSTGKSKEDGEDQYRYCVYSSDIATGYGVGAFLLLMASQAIIMAASKCFCCGNPLKPGGSRACAVLLFIFCWVTFFIAEACLLAGSVRNAYHTKYRTLFFNSPPSCETVRKGVFAAGAAFVLFTGIISEFYYVSYSKARGSFRAYGGGEAGVGMTAYK